MSSEIVPSGVAPGISAGLPVCKAVVRLLPWGLCAACLWVLSQQIASETWTAIPRALHNISPVQWLLAICATGCSFVAVARYDVTLHRHLVTGCDPRRAGRVGAASIALSQTLGMGVLTGALIRWKLLAELSVGTATRLTIAVTVSFLFGLLCLISTACLLVPNAALPQWGAAILCSLCLGVVALAFWTPVWRLFRFTLHLPSLPLLGAIVWWTLVDTLAACVALAVLMPDPAALPFLALLPAFLIALGAGLVTGSPGGVGPFELTLLALLPALPEATLITGIVAFRIVYYAMPACVAMLFMLCPARTANQVNDPTLRPLSPQSDLPPTRPVTEHGVCRQNGAQILSNDPRTHLAVVPTPHTMTQMFAPLRGAAGSGWTTLTALARDTGRVACVYKCDARSAATLRKAGACVLHIADDAIIDLAKFNLTSPRLRQLRRKLRQAERAGVCVRNCADHDTSALTRIDTEWQVTHGRARGFSMGRYCPDYLNQQRVYVAYLACNSQKPIAFVSWHVTQSELCLDLMRHGPDLPTGTMHTLVMAAITDAKTSGQSRVSMAALPCETGSGLVQKIRAQMTQNPGLTHFKSSFAPRRAPRYALANSPVALALALADIARCIRNPDDITPPNNVAKSNPIHINHEDYEFALR